MVLDFNLAKSGFESLLSHFAVENHEKAYFMPLRVR